MKKHILGRNLVLILMVLFFVGLGCGSGKTENKPLSKSVEKEDKPLSRQLEKVQSTYNKSPSSLKSLNVDIQDKAIYGKDDRLDYHAADMEKKKAADSTVLLTNKSHLMKTGDGNYSLKTETFYFDFKPPCKDEPFLDTQNVGGWCSGFLVGLDLVATAGHCVKTDEQAENTAFVFGFRMDNVDTQVTKFPSNKIYWGKKLIAQKLNQSMDYAIVQLDREVTTPEAKVLKVRRNGSAISGANVGVIGYPSGLPVKIAFGEETIVMKNDGNFLMANLDTYGGNSGSAVFDKNIQQVEGILVRGNADYEVDSTDDCYRSVRYDNNEGSEWVTKSAVFQHFIPPMKN